MLYNTDKAKASLHNLQILLMQGDTSMKKLGFGTMRLPLIPGGKQTDIDQEQFNRMADYFLENGFIYVDTAYMYHDFKSENAVKKAFVDRHPRDSFLLADKMPVAMTKSAEEFPKIFEEQLSKCGVDYFDYYMLHDVTRQTIGRIEDGDGFGFLMKLKENGKIKHAGFSYHDNAELLDDILAKHPEVEFVQLQINYVDWDDNAIQSGKCYDVCVKHGKKVLVMEPVKGGGLANLPEKADELLKSYAPDSSAASWAVRFAASLDNVIMVLSGMSTFEQMQDNISYMKDFTPLCGEEREIIKKAVEIVKNSFAVPCTGCRYCVNHTPGCPMNIAIPEFFAIYNNVHQYGSAWGTIQAYRSLSRDYGTPADCIECGQCEEHCPQHIDIINKLKEVPVL